MDSITQAALGAAMGEAVLGKKIGNRAILVGAIAGTIPDLDVVSRLFIDHEVYGLLYHRGITHSILFTLVMPFLFAGLMQQYYQRDWYKKKWLQAVWSVWWSLFYALILFAFVSLTWWTKHWVPALLSVGMLGVGYALFQTFRKNIKNPDRLSIDFVFKDWVFMFFWAFLTHWFIDACTAYGTQIFEPFSRYRVAFNNIFIIDPLYTVPLLIGLVGAFFARKGAKRTFWNGLGITLSTLYMASTFYSKSLVNKVIEQNLAAQNIEYIEYISFPSVANTILWQTTVVSEDAYYYGMYSLLDSEPKIEFVKLPKNHELLEDYRENELVKVLLWFAQGYYNVTKRENGELQFNNLRFGLMGGGLVKIKDPYIFKFTVGERAGKTDVWQARRMEEDWDTQELLGKLWERIKGI